jgi:hypothetical protein
MEKYPFRILLVKIGEKYHLRVVYQEDMAYFHLTFRNQRDEIKDVSILSCDCPEFSIDNNGGSLFLRGHDESQDHTHSRIASASWYYTKDLAISLNKSIKEHYELSI